MQTQKTYKLFKDIIELNQELTLYCRLEIGNCYYRFIVFRKSLMLSILLNNLKDFSSQQYCCVEYLLKIFVEMVNKRDLIKVLKLVQSCDFQLAGLEIKRQAIIN